MARNRQFGELSARARSRAYQAGKRYGLSESAVRHRYNRGTYNPFARDNPLQRIPAEMRREAVITREGMVEVDWKAAAFSNMLNRLGDYFKWNEFEVMRNLENIRTDALRAMALATEDELIQLAHVQNPKENPDLPFDLKVKDIGYYVIGSKSGEREWINVFWYH